MGLHGPFHKRYLPGATEQSCRGEAQQTSHSAISLPIRIAVQQVDGEPQPEQRRGTVERGGNEVERDHLDTTPPQLVCFLQHAIALADTGC